MPFANSRRFPADGIPTTAASGGRPAGVRTRLRLRGRLRPGMTVLVVLGVLSVSLAIAFTMLHSQMASEQLTSNYSRLESSRQAALTGAAAALRRLASSDWGGVDEVLVRVVERNVWFEVRYAPGDDLLTSSDEDYAELPFRLTITSTGTAADPGNTTLVSQYVVTAVVELERKKLSSAPSTWAKAQNYTVYQSSNNDAFVQFPVQIKGPAMIQGPLKLLTEYPTDSTIRQGYLKGLNDLYVTGQGDMRPFTQSVKLGTGRTGATTKSLLSSTLQLSVSEVSLDAVPPATPANSVTSYQLYPGGPVYEIPNLTSLYGSSLANLSLGPDPVDNPLGVFRTNGGVTLWDNVSLQGVLMTQGYQADVTIAGDNVLLQGADLPALANSSTKRQLPAAIIADDLLLSGGSENGQLQGLCLCGDDFTFLSGTQNTSFRLQGRLIASELKLYGRTEWIMSPSTWSSLWSLYNFFGSDGDLFPLWVYVWKRLSPVSTLTLEPPLETVSYHWHDWSQPLYQADPSDGALRWKLIRWQENE
ncbi:hypothetical protein [Lignipirellula cremea]|uniref:Uncharacterized protein n=1 Tax=Lignipirellula cremea TaxID=2528010 RepID=A0A518DSE9_9BACT|nr:hypothetical protein [Lignipirellula cremea]QDU94759.1 hypothetical protein Pla8534_25660 [Lignipirellula cremea]